MVAPLRSERVIVESPGSVKGFSKRAVNPARWRFPFNLIGIPLSIMLFLLFLLVIVLWTLATWVLFPLPKLAFRWHRRNVRQRKQARLRHRELMSR